jgi:hypothetical protein
MFFDKAKDGPFRWKYQAEPEQLQKSDLSRLTGSKGTPSP